MGRYARACRLLPMLLQRYWFAVVWIAACSLLFYYDYIRYKREPQYYYTRRMLGLGLCVSRGSAAVLNLSCCCLVLPMCRALTTALGAALTRPHHRTSTLPATLAAPVTYAAKTTHIIIALTVIVSAVVHSVAHLANAYNFSRNYSGLYPKLNVASYKGESPVWIFVTTVPGITGVAMVVVLALVGVSSWHRVRRPCYNLFYYTHHLGFIFLLLLIIHPLSGVLKEQKNLDGHFPGCQMHADSHPEEEGFPEPGFGVKSVHSQNITSLDDGYPEPSPDMEYAYSEPSDKEYAYPESSDKEYGYPEPLDKEYGYPEPSDKEYGYPEPSDMDYGYPEPSDTNHGYSDLSQYHGSLHSSLSLENSGSNKDSFNQEVGKGEREHHKRRMRRKCQRPPEFVAVNSQTYVWVGGALTVWGLDWIVRWVQRRRHEGKEGAEVAGVMFLPCSVVQLTLRLRSFTCKPGQYVLVQCPRVSRFEWHPFTVMAAERETSSDTLTVLIQARGDWTGQVSALLRSQCYPKNMLQHNSHATSCSSQNAYPIPLQQSSQSYSLSSTFIPVCSNSQRATNSDSPSSGSYLGIIPPVQQIDDKKICSMPSCLCNIRYEKYSLREDVPPVALRQCAKTDKLVSYSDTNICNLKPCLNHISPKTSRARPPSHRESSLLQCNRAVSYSHLHNLRKSAIPALHKKERLKKEETAEKERNTRPGTHKISLVHKYPYTVHDRLTRHKVDWEVQNKREHTVEEKLHHIILTPVMSDVRFHIDGPFSSPSEALLSYPVIIGTAGGLGITPLAATLHHIRWCSSTWPQRIHIVWVVRDASLLLSVAPLLSNLLHHCWDAHTEDRLELCLHVTRPTPPHLQELLAEYPVLLPRVNQGRPHWKHLFRQWQLAYRRSRVGVFSCGPSKMRRQVKHHCHNAVSRGAAFHYHQEIFS